MKGLRHVYVSGCFDDVRSRDMLFLYQAAQYGPVTVFLWSDEVCQQRTGNSPVFPLPERAYFLQSIRYVNQLCVVEKLDDPHSLPEFGGKDPIWFVMPDEDDLHKRRFCLENGVGYQIFEWEGNDFPVRPISNSGLSSDKQKILVTGSYDFLHSGHIRFFEVCASLGDLYVIVGHDDNIRLLKGEGHPVFPQEERLFMVQSIRYVKHAALSTGHGWMDAAQEVDRIQPDVYVVNQDGDVTEKRDFCHARGIEYLVLPRLPKPGLPARRSTNLRRKLAGSEENQEQEKC